MGENRFASISEWFRKVKKNPRDDSSRNVDSNIDSSADKVMQPSFQQNVIDSMPGNIALLDESAIVVMVNRSWKDFADSNGLKLPDYCIGTSYMDVCMKALASFSDKSSRNNISGDPGKKEPAPGIQKKDEKAGASPSSRKIVIQEEDHVQGSGGRSRSLEMTIEALQAICSGEKENFSIEYPCHSNNEQRWFRAEMRSFCFDDRIWIIISHQNITRTRLAEISFDRTRNQLQGIIDSIPDAMCMVDIDQNIVWSNGAAEALYGIKLTGKKCYSAYGISLSQCKDCIVRKTFLDGKVHSRKYHHTDINGNQRIIHSISSVSGYDSSGNISHVMEIMQDITEKIEKEKTLRFMQTAVENTGDGVYWINPNGSIKYVNRYTLEYTGYSEKEILSLHVHDIDPLVTPESWIEAWNDLRKVKTKRFETLHRTKNGENIPCEVTASLIVFNENEEYNFALVRNISARKQADKEIRRLSQAVEYTPASVVITDTDGNIEYVNRKFCQVTGYSKEEATGKNPRILNSGQIPKSYFEDLWKTILDGRDWKGEFVNRKKNGELYWESASISPVIDADGKIAYFVAVKEDITELKKIMGELTDAKKKAESATRAKSDFLATISHEIRTPMNAIMGMCNIMMDTELNHVQQSYLNNINSAADSLLSIINDVLDLSKIEAGKMELQSVQFQWNQIIEKIFNVLKFTADKKKIDLIYSFGKNIPQFMIGDPVRLSQVIMNLAGNAVKYTTSGEVVVHTEVISENSENLTLSVSIRDTGIGISREKISSLFTPFTQVDSSATRRYGGTGLGLVIAKRIVNAMGGEIFVESKPEEGSTFTFDVILAKIRQNGLYKSVPCLNILVIEPRVSTRNALTESLESLECSATGVSGGEEGLMLIDRTYVRGNESSASDLNPPFDAVFINALLPEGTISCVETLKKLRSDSRNSGTKYIVMHDFRFSEEALKITDHIDVDLFITRPVTPVSLINALTQITDRDRGSAGNESHPDQTENQKTDQKRDRRHLSSPSIEEENDVFSSLSGKKIMVVDDDIINLQIVRAILNKWRINNVIMVETGKQALETVRELLVSDTGSSSDKDHQSEPATPPDLILMDVEMPVMDGLTATGLIREIEDIRAKDIPIIALTGHAFGEYRDRCLQAGMNDHIDKPIKPEKLLSAIRKWLLPTD